VERLLLCPPGEPATHASLATCLHQVSKMSGIGALAASAVHSVAILLEEMEDTAIDETVRDAVISQFNELTLDMRNLVTDVKEKIDTHMQKFPAGAQTNTATSQPSHVSQTYAEALVNPPSHANPRLAAREAIRARQFMLEGLGRDSKLGQMGSPQLKTELNRVAGKLGLKGNGICSALPQKHRGVLIKVDDDDAVNWLKLDDNRATFCSALGPNVMFKA